MIIRQLITMGERTVAELTAVAFALYLRPSEALSLTTDSLVRPSSLHGGPQGTWSVTLHPREAGVSSKTGVYDDSLLIDGPAFPWMPDLLAKLLRSRSPGAKLFDVSYNTWNAKFAQAARAAGLQPLLPVTLHQLRHGGASHELLVKARPQDEVKKRGRWATDQAVRRYAKGGRIQEQLNALPKTIQDVARRCMDTIGAVLCAT